VDLHLDDDGMDLAPYGIAGRVVHTPGHTYGSVSVLLDTGEAFVGDLVMNRLPLRRTPGMAIFGEDEDLMKSSLLKLAGLGARVIYPAHGPSFELERLVRNLDGSNK
jgi:glyoxylase-like metal-dependent hydrolase (beta-lactamase superfamily II)